MAVAAAAAVMTMGAPAQAAVPAVAQTWSTLMYRSLTPSAESIQLRTRLTTQQAAFAGRVTAVTKAKLANAAAQNLLITDTTADAAARTRWTAAKDALTAAKTSLTAAGKLKPKDAGAVTKAKTVVTAATAAEKTRKAQSVQAAAALKAAEAAARTATTNLGAALAAWRDASTAVAVTQQKITGLRSTASVSAGQAAALSKDVVTQVRAGFTVADTTTVYGVTVHKSVAYAFQRMLDDAKADGVVMSGGGFRTKERQIELRTINGCPDVFTAPSSSCRVPTAIPGRSLHELGLAVDITSGGRTINAASPAFRWLTANAARYGYVNLPSEAWHWSITGS